MNQSTERSSEGRPRETTLDTVANPRRTRVDAEGRPVPVPVVQRTTRD